MKTRAHQYDPYGVYGKQVARGNMGERAARRELCKRGYSCRYSDTHPHGWADIVASKRGSKKMIQVKRISSRNFKTPEACKHRMKNIPYNIKSIPKGCEVWVYDKSGRRYEFKHNDW